MGPKPGKTRALAPMAAACATAVALAGSAEVQWSFYTPANTGIPGDYVRCVLADPAGPVVWITGFIPFWEQGGVARFDGETWLTVTNVDYPEIASPRFNDVVRDQDGIMWFASDHGLLRYDPAAGAVTRYDHGNSPMPANVVSGVDVAPDGAVWIAMYDLSMIPNGGLARFDPAGGTWDAWTTANGLPWGGQVPTVNAIEAVAVAPDAGGGFTVWFSNDLGMSTYQGGVFTWFGYNPPPGGPITPVALKSNQPVDNLGNVWMHTNQGLARRAPDGTYALVGYPPGFSASSISRVVAAGGGRALAASSSGYVFRYEGSWANLGLWGGQVGTFALAEEAGGAVWAGGVGGAARYAHGSWQRYRVTNTGMVGYLMRAIAFDGAGNVYMNGNAAPGVGGFDILHPDGTWTNANVLTYGLGLPWPFPAADTDALCGRANGHLALAPTWSGLYEWDGTGYQEHLAGWPIKSIIEDGTGRLWAAPGTGHLFREGEAGFDHYDGMNSPMPVGDFGALFPDPEAPGFVWVAAMFGLARTDGDTWTVYPRELLGLTEYTIDQVITCAGPAAGGTLWVGSGVGLFHFDPASLQYTRYDLTNAPLPSQFIHRLQVAPDGSVWLSSQDLEYPYAGGLTHFDGADWTTYSQGSSPLPQNQLGAINARAVPGGYELWIGTATEGIAVVRVLSSPGDLDGDGVVGVLDLLALLAAWGPCPEPCPPSCPADLDGNCAVGVTDLLTLLANWG